MSKRGFAMKKFATVAILAFIVLVTLPTNGFCWLQGTGIFDQLWRPTNAQTATEVKGFIVADPKGDGETTRIDFAMKYYAGEWSLRAERWPTDQPDRDSLIAAIHDYKGMTYQNRRGLLPDFDSTMHVVLEPEVLEPTTGSFEKLIGSLGLDSFSIVREVFGLKNRPADHLGKVIEWLKDALKSTDTVKNVFATERGDEISGVVLADRESNGKITPIGFTVRPSNYGNRPGRFSLDLYKWVSTSEDRFHSDFKKAFPIYVTAGYTCGKREIVNEKEPFTVYFTDSTLNLSGGEKASDHPDKVLSGLREIFVRQEGVKDIQLLN
jgi:hypothetical protein